MQLLTLHPFGSGTVVFSSNKRNLCLLILKCLNLIYLSDGDGLDGSYSKFGQASSDNFWLDNVQCSGTEPSIEKCPHNGWGDENCAASEAAKVICKKSKNLNLNLILYF